MNQALAEMVQQYRRALDSILAYRFHVPPTQQDVINIKRIAREAEEAIPRITTQD
jgi:hypothetical protein